MRTVLVVDDLLALQVRRQLSGEVAELGHVAMRGLGDKAPWALRKLVLERPSVLAMGARAWVDSLATLRRMRLPKRVPVVLLLPTVDRASYDEAARLGVFSIVPLVEVSGVSRAVVTECKLAAIAIAEGTFSSSCEPCVVRLSRAPLRARTPLPSVQAPKVFPPLRAVMG